MTNRIDDVEFTLKSIDVLAKSANIDPERVFAASMSNRGACRIYLLRIALKHDAKKPTPVILAVHGGGGNADSMVVFSGLNKKADEMARRLHIRPTATTGLGSEGQVNSTRLAALSSMAEG